jgi:dolichol-phosphate mannosyltransferase
MPIMRQMPGFDVENAETSIIVPVRNEAGNLPELCRRIKLALAGRLYEILVIDDDSEDGTIEICTKLSQEHPLKLHTRLRSADGLSGAVIYGLDRALGEYLVVMDGDLQHPPERISDLLGPLAAGEAELVLGSRYIAGGSTDGRWGRLRQINSRLATLIARPFAGETRDPMSGFFALRRHTYLRAPKLNPVGYKVALEIICKCRIRRMREVPLHFGIRQSGESKLTLREQFRYLDHVSRLYDFCFPSASPRVKFALATSCAWFIAFGLYLRLVAHDVNPVYAPTLAFVAAAGATAAFHLRSLRSRSRGMSARDWFDLMLVLLGEWSICVLVARWAAYHLRHATALDVFILAFGAATVVRYVLRKKLFHNLRGIRSQ